jgi:curli biogenesis system outer membrane secretion channel CsgG
MKQILFILLIILLTGCSTKYGVSIKSLKAAKVSDSAIKNISVLKFKNDDVGEASQIEQVLNTAQINGKKYFNVVDRNNLQAIINEKKLDYSGLVNVIHKGFGIHQVEALVIGKINVNSKKDTFFQEERIDRSRCSKYEYVKTKRGSYKYCVRYYHYHVNCKGREYHLQTSIKIVKVKNAKVIFAKTYDKSTYYKHCSDDNNVIPSKKDVNSILARDIANEFINDIAPHYVYFYTYLLDEIDVDMDSNDEDMFEASLKLIKLGRIQKANQVLLNLYRKYSQSYVLAYDLAITQESLGNIYKAKTLLLRAENLALKDGKVIDEIETAIKRVDNSIAELEKAKKQF